jgi:hypothetical protein
MNDKEIKELVVDNGEYIKDQLIDKLQEIIGLYKKNNIHEELGIILLQGIAVFIIESSYSLLNKDKQRIEYIEKLATIMKYHIKVKNK